MDTKLNRRFVCVRALFYSIAVFSGCYGQRNINKKNNK